MDSKKVKLFVYGTLREGEHRHDLLEGAPLVASTKTEPGFSLINLGDYPGMRPGGAGCVYGEIYAINASLLPVLDEYEDYPTLYDRVPIQLANGVTALTYLLLMDTNSPVIESGDWKKR